MLRKSIPCMAAGLLFTAGLFLFTAAYIFPEWQPGWSGLLFWTAISFLIIGGTWLWDEVHEVRRRRLRSRLSASLLTERRSADATPASSA
jgi:hypothetical protein